MLVNNDYSYYLNVDIMSYATQNLKLINIFDVGLMVNFDIRNISLTLKLTPSVIHTYQLT